MPKLNTEFLDQSLLFHSKSEDDLELAINFILDERNGAPCREKDLKDVSSAVYEQLSPLREALIDWYPFQKGSRILEIGAGFGALTGVLLRNSGATVALEVKASRCKLIKKRYSYADNLEVMSCDMFSYHANHKFDYIVVHDFFGYIRKHIHAADPYSCFFDKVKQLLKQDGVILLAVENKLGLKYFSGCVEDYSYKFFTGLNHFDGYDGIRTFSKKELADMLKQQNLGRNRFFYPFPDNVFPTEIYTDEILDKKYYGGRVRSTSWNKFEFFDEAAMFRRLQEEGIVSAFANSFLIEINPSSERKPIYYHGKGLHIAGKSLKEATIDSYRRLNQDDNQLEPEAVRLPEGVFLSMYLQRLLDRSLIGNVKPDCNIDHLLRLLKQLSHLLRNNGVVMELNPESKFCRLAGETKGLGEWLCRKDLPLYCDMDGFFTDGEHICPLPWQAANYYIPADYMVWLLTDTWYQTSVTPYKSLSASLDLSTVYRACGINIEKLPLFRRWKKGIDSLAPFYLEHHYKANYRCNFTYPVDVCIQGDRIIDEDFEQKNTDEASDILIYENNLLDTLRR